jgi:hypothetical protein
LTEIKLYPKLNRFSQDMQLFSALVSTISSPDFHVVELSFHEEVLTDDLAQELVHLEEWEHLEAALMKLYRGSGDSLRVVTILSDRVQLLPCCDDFMPRFREVGEIRFSLA